jgi:hypothetical protein
MNSYSFPNSQPVIRLLKLKGTLYATKVWEVDKVLLFHRKPQKTGRPALDSNFRGLFLGKEKGSVGFRLAGNSVEQLFFQQQTLIYMTTPYPSALKKRPDRSGLLMTW